MVVGKLTTEIIEKFVYEFKKNENQEKLKAHVIDPVICYFIDKLYPYIFITSTIFILTFVIAILILFLIIKSNYYK
jgi:hypothetical protein